MKRLLLACALVACPLTALPQSTTTATVVIYQTPHARMLKRAAPEVFVDDRLAAKLDGGRYFVLKLAPGVHTFRSKNKKNGGAEIEVKAGETYYLRLTMEHTGYFLKFSGINLVPSEQGRYTVRQLKAIHEKDIKDRALVDVTVTEQALKSAAP